MSLFKGLGVPALLLVAAACQNDSASTAPPAIDATSAVGTAPGIQAGPHALFADSTAPAIANPFISFWARKGRRSEVFMYYKSRPGHNDSTVFIRFRVREGSLAFRPDGRPIHYGDSIRITIRLVDPVRLGIDCQPSGLRFNPNDPADLKMSYLETDDDRDRDGDVDLVDAQLTKKIRIWDKDPGVPWMKLPGTISLSGHEVESDILGFTSYALAY
jgi:hypothetical protein